MINIFQKTEELKSNGIHTALCIIVSTQGSTPLKTGAKMLVDETGKIYGTIGGGNFEKKVIDDALEMIIKNESKLFVHHLLQEHGMCCGGTVNVYIESVMPPEKLYIFGSGHVGRALSQFASELYFQVHVVDERMDEISKIKNDAVNKITQGYKEVLSDMVFNDKTYIAIMTYDHHIDREILAFCIKQKFAYLGMIGSRRKVEVTRKMFLNSGICNNEALEKVDMPMGFDINSTGPEEIAISILAKIIEVKNKKTSVRKNNNTNTDFNIPIEECRF